MISYAEAKALIHEHAFLLKPSQRPIEHISGLVLAEAVVANFDMPRFDNAEKDGYGVKILDIQRATPDKPVSLQLQGAIQAGDFSVQALNPGETFKIMTGAAIPPGVEAIVMKEFCREEDDTIWIYQPSELGEHIRRQGEEFYKGHEILPYGTIASPPVVGLLAALGYTVFSVYPSPRVALLLTGDELVQPGNSLRPGQIYDANSYALRAALQQLGISHCTIYYARDKYEDTLGQFHEALISHDVVLTVGGISVGDFDFVKEVLENSGVQTIFWKVAMKPGKPFYFGKYEQASDRKLIFGLPGNPVSALLTFHQLVQPALASLMGKTLPESKYFKVRLTKSLKKQVGRLSWVRGVRSEQDGLLQVEPVQAQDSHMLCGLATADCLINFPETVEFLSAQEYVLVEPLSWVKM